MLKTQAISEFLKQNTEQDLAELYTPEMEVHVNVAQDGGKKIEGKTKSGHNWWGFSDGTITWKHIRIPWGASDNPRYVDSDLQFPTARFDGVGMTGWDWKNRVSRWVGFDFDSIVGHKKGLSETELLEIQNKVKDVEWVNVRRSTSGAGLHFYVFLLNPVSTQNHTEHAALARAILGWLSVKVGHRFDAQVDACGGVLWVWHRRKKELGFKLLKAGTGLLAVPQNWQDHVPVIERKAPRIRFYGDTTVDAIVTKTKFKPLTERHKRLIGWFEHQNEKLTWWWDSDRHMMVCHTYDLKRAHAELNLQGVFTTVAQGKDKGHDQNCFMFPINPGWIVRRHSKNVHETNTWEVDTNGWTKCFFDNPTDWETACRASKGNATRTGSYVFESLAQAKTALESLNTAIQLPSLFYDRACEINRTRDGKIVVSVSKHKTDPWYPGWAPERGEWTYVVKTELDVKEMEVPDENVRHLISNGEDAGWYFRARDMWIAESRGNIQLGLSAMGCNQKEATILMGHCVLNYWTLVCEPFKPEYPGDRKWNRHAPQLSAAPKPGDHPYWDRMLRHIGAGLDHAVQQSDWCRQASVSNGEDYLKFWIASMFQFPYEPLPYLFFYGDQNTGKSLFHEAISLLFMNKKGCTRVDHALTNNSGFNGELLGTILGIIEETDLRRQKDAYNRIKDWVTAKTISIHEKGNTPYDVVSTLHFVQASNNPSYCPVFPGDTRIVVCRVRKPEQEIPKAQFIDFLTAEIPYFLNTILTLSIAPTSGRLRIPVIASDEKFEQEAVNEDPVAVFCKKHFIPANGSAISVEDAFVKFLATLPASHVGFWSVKRFAQAIPEEYVKGQYNGYLSIANVSWSKPIQEFPRLIRDGSRLVDEVTLHRRNLDLLASRSL